MTSHPQPQQQYYGGAAPQPHFAADGYAAPDSAAPSKAVVTRQPYRYDDESRKVDMGDFKNQWSTGLCTSCCTSPLVCLGGCLCSCCCVCYQRKEILQGDWSQYRCCQGYWCSCCSDCCNAVTPEACAPCCLCCESVWCLTCAQHANRVAIRQHYELEGSCCEMCIVHTLSCLSCCSCICDCEWLSLILHCIMHCTIGCMIAQQSHHMNEHGYPMKEQCDVIPADVTR